MKIDIFPHILTPRYLEAASTKYRDPKILSFVQQNARRYPTLYDLDRRFRLMDEHEDLVQVLTLSSPALEAAAGPKEAAELARISNDELAELVARHPARFVGAVATLPMNDIDAALTEADRAISKLGMRGVQIYTPVDGKAIDLPEFMPLYQLMSQHDLPIWLHPRREFDVPDYPTEPMSKYGIAGKFGWPYETSVAMARLAYSGVLEKYPTLKVITHHAGGMVPFFHQRITHAIPQAEDPSRPGVWEYNIELSQAALARARRPWVEYFQMFYNDTAVWGSTPALMCAYAFFGADHLLFGTDMPYCELGDRVVLETIRSIEHMGIPQSERAKIFELNARRLLRLPA